MTSPDGVRWTRRRAATSDLWFSVTHGEGVFVAVGFEESTPVMTSPDGIAWTEDEGLGDLTETDWDAVTYADGLFVAVSISANPDGLQVMTSGAFSN